MTVRRTTRLRVYGLLLVAALLAGFGGAAATRAQAPATGPSAYRGAGAWVDIYSPSVLSRPEQAVAEMQATGVRTLYLETANYRQGAEVDIVRPLAVGRLLEAAHARGLRVVAWYLPSFADRRRDLRRSLAAIRFTTPGRQRFDSFALDMEATVIGSIARRNRALLSLSRSIRAAVGPEYQLGAIVPDQRSTTCCRALWPGFPYRSLASLYDVFLPMSYSSLRGEGAGYVYRYTRDNVRFIRRQAGDPSVPVHVIGGLAYRLDTGEAHAVVRAARRTGAIGASFYKFSISGPEEDRALASWADR